MPRQEPTKKAWKKQACLALLSACQITFQRMKCLMRITWQPVPGTVRHWLREAARHWLRLAAPVLASAAEESVAVVF